MMSFEVKKAKLICVLWWAAAAAAAAAFQFGNQAPRAQTYHTVLHLEKSKGRNINDSSNDHSYEYVQDMPGSDRRRFLFSVGAASCSTVMLPNAPASAEGKSFAPGGTLVDYEVGVTVGNAEASKSRKSDNSNVLFNQDYYFKFGTAPQWIEDGNTDFPKTMPFSPSQQRYDTNKKYRERVQRGIDLVTGLEQAVKNGEYSSILPGSDPQYSLRPMGLLANGFLATENTGTTNELLLSRWYINEIGLQIDDVKNAASKDEAVKSYKALVKATNSYMALLNRVITSKVGDKFAMITPSL